MLTQTLRKAHNEALKQLTIIEVMIKMIADAKAEHNKEAVECYTEMKLNAIAKYTEQMRDIIEPVMLHK